MREIKFRGKRLDNGEWEYGDLLQYDDGSVCIGVHSKNYTDDGFNVGQYHHIAPVNEDTVGEYTGLKDRKGIAIYEGIQGDSASGKTTLVNMIRQAENLGESSGINVSCEVPCRVLEGVNWKIILENSRESIFFIDEENYFIKTEEFASAIRGSENYFVLITRENLYNLPYSVEEIYGLHVSGKYRDTRKIYQKMYQIYPKTARLPVRVQKIITEDSNSGYQFFENVCAERNITCESAGGKTKIPEMIGKAGTEETCIIADGAAIGAEMNLLSNKIEEKQNVHLYLPESFEWLILNSDLLQDKEVRKILENPEDYIDSTEFFSWEQYFTKLLIQKTEGTYLQYKKAKLNPSYLQDKNKNKILESIQGIQWKIKSLK